MKVLILTNGMNPKNGWGRLSSDLVGGLRNAGLDVVVLKEIDDGYEGFPVLQRGVSVFLTALKIRRFIKECDIVHAIDGYPYAIIAALANIGLNKKFVVTAVGTYSVAPLYRWKLACLLRWTYRRADLIASISNYTKEAILSRVASLKISVINPGIDLVKFHKPHQFPGEKIILSVGAFKFHKGYHVSIPAFALFREKFPDFSYIIVGNQADVGYFNNLKNMVNDLNINSSIRFISGIPDKDLPDIYSRASAFILTSVNEYYNFEGFGLVFLEAAAAGLPVVGTTGNGIEDAVKNGFNGILVPQNSIQKTAEALTEIVSTEEAAKKFSRNSYDWSNQHSIKKMADEYTGLYKNILNNTT